METFNKLKGLLEETTEDMVKFTEKGNKAAGIRIRKTMQEVKKLAQEIRIQISKNK